MSEPTITIQEIQEKERERERHDTSFLSHNIQNEAEIISEPEWT